VNAMNRRLEWMAESGMVAFDLDFLRLLGYEFELDWDGALTINSPDHIDVEAMTEVTQRFSTGILKRLQHERLRAMSVCVGGPRNGRECLCGREQVRFHTGRGQWHVYQQKNHGWPDPRYWYVGQASRYHCPNVSTSALSAG